MVTKIFKSIDKTLMHIEEGSLFVAVCVALLTAMANVIRRKATNDLRLYWSDEAVRKVICFSTYIGCVAAIRSRSLIRIDALPQMLPVMGVMMFLRTLIVLWEDWSGTNDITRGNTQWIPRASSFLLFCPAVWLRRCRCSSPSPSP